MSQDTNTSVEDKLCQADTSSRHHVMGEAFLLEYMCVCVCVCVCVDRVLEMDVWLPVAADRLKRGLSKTGTSCVIQAITTTPNKPGRS